MLTCFGSTHYELTLSVIQSAILFCYEKKDGPISFFEFKAILNMEDEILKKNLLSLVICSNIIMLIFKSCGKQKYLLKSTPENKISETDTFRFNIEFKSPHKKINLPLISYEEKLFKKGIIN